MLPTSSTTPFLDALVPHLPRELSTLGCLRHPSSHAEMETLLCFALGGDCLAHATEETRRDWASRQPEAVQAVRRLLGAESAKRARDGNGDGDGSFPAKRARTGLAPPAIDDEGPLFTLPAVSATSPVRRRADIAVHARSLRLVGPASRTTEASLPLAHISRAFLLPTRGKARPHWTVVLLSADAPDKGQVLVFGIDALTTSAFETTTYPSTSTVQTATTERVPKGSPTRPSLLRLLAFLPAPLLEPCASVFRSASAKAGDGAAGVDAYRATRTGTLWFFDGGVLWGESRLCEFWAVADLVPGDGVRLLSATGRTCSVILRRGRRREGVRTGAEDEDEVDETEFTMVDGREQDPIHAWVRQRRPLFGKALGAPDTQTPPGAGQSHTASSSANGPAWDDSDPDDDDYEIASSADGAESARGGGTSGSSASGGSLGASDAGSEGAGQSDEEAEAEAVEGPEELDEARHPLLRPGAMPRMSKAALNAVVDMVNADFGGGGSSGEEDELDDD